MLSAHFHHNFQTNDSTQNAAWKNQQKSTELKEFR